MKFSIISLAGKRAITVALTLLFVMPFSVASAAPVVKSETDFDIPISELNKVKKKSPSKRVTSDSKKRKKSVVKSGESTAETAKPVDPAGLANIQPTVDKPLSDSEKIQIHHSPYSFVVAGKRSVIYAVISSKADTKEIICSIRAAEGAAPTLVKMEKVRDTQFTYTATLPGLSSETGSLRYTIIAVDSLGKETRSNEFVTPMTSSPVVPGWQIEDTGEAIKTEQKDSGKHVDGLSAPVISTEPKSLPNK